MADAIPGDAPSEDEGSRIDGQEIRVGGITYSISAFRSGDKFVTAWRCPVCKRRQGCPHRTETQVEAFKCAEEEVRSHHVECHQPAPAG